MLLNGRPTALTEAIQAAIEIEFALDFGEDDTESPAELAQVFALQNQQQANQEMIHKLQEAVEGLT